MSPKIKSSLSSTTYNFLQLQMSKLKSSLKYLTKAFRILNQSTLSFENKSKYKNKIKDKLTCGSLWGS